MRIFLSVLVLILLAAPVFSAENPAVKGNFVVSLPLFSYEKGMGDFDNASSFSFLAMGYQAEVQYFFIDSLAAGGKVGYQKDKDESGTVKTFSFEPVANYYFTFIKAPVIPYAGAGFLYEQKNINGEKITTTSLQLQGGAVYMLSKHLAAYGELLLSFGKKSDGSSASGEMIGFDLGVKAFF